MKAFVALTLLAANAAQADEANRVSLQALYLSEATEWCSPGRGVPVLITADGPEVFAAPPAEESFSVTVRRGGEATEKVDVGRLGVSKARTTHGGKSRTFDRLYPRIEEVTKLGRLRARFQVCDTFWAKEVVSSDWTIEAPDGTVVRFGKAPITIMSGKYHPLFSNLGRFPKAFTLGDQTVVVMAEPEIQNTTETNGSPAKEQNQ